MPIETLCPGCSKKLRVADEHAGKQARCPSCGHIYTVAQLTPSSYSPLPTESPAPAATTAFNPPAKSVPEQWFLKIDDGREFGPIDRPTLDQWFRERRIGPTSQLKNELQGYWQPAVNVYPALANAPTPAAGPSNISGQSNPFSDQPQYAANPNPYAAPNAVAGGNLNVEPHRGGLILTLGIVGLCCCQIVGIVAWVMAAQDLKKMNEGRMDRSGQGMTTAGMVLGIIAVVLLALSIVLNVAQVAFMR